MPWKGHCSSCSTAHATSTRTHSHTHKGEPKTVFHWIRSGTHNLEVATNFLHYCLHPQVDSLNFCFLFKRDLFSVEGCKPCSRRCQRKPECDKTCEISCNSEIVPFWLLCANHFFYLLSWSKKTVVGVGLKFHSNKFSLPCKPIRLAACICNTLLALVLVDVLMLPDQATGIYRNVNAKWNPFVR